MTIKHHLDDDTLFAYAAGNLPEAFNLIIAAHVSLCDDCRAVVESFDTLGGALLDGGDVAEMNAESLSRTLARIETAQPEARVAPKPGTLPTPIRDYVGGDLDAIKWRPIGMGVKQAILKTSDAATARLLLIPAGAAIPDHSHKGTEMTLVLKGAYQDEEDRFARGDIEIADGEVSHTPVADTDQDCICLIVTEAPLRFKGFLPKVAQRFARI